MQNFIPVLLKNVYVQALFHGNLTQERARQLMGIVEAELLSTKDGERRESRPMRKSQQFQTREVQLTPNSSCVFMKTTEVHKSSCIENYYQCGQRSTRSDMVMRMTAQILQEPCFDQLRTKEQLGYVVWSGIKRKAGVQGLRVLIMSDKHPSHVDERIEAFLDTMLKNIAELPDEDFDKHKAAVRANILEKPKKLASRTSQYWIEIYAGNYNFDRDNIDADDLDSVTKEEVLAFYKEHISRQSDKRRKLSCHVVSKTEDGAGTVDERPIPDGAVQVMDAEDFKSHRGLYPRLEPYAALTSMRNKNYTCYQQV